MVEDNKLEVEEADNRPVEEADSRWAEVPCTC